MSIRDRLLEVLQNPEYKPANEVELARRLELRKKQRHALAHEVRLLLKTGNYVRTGQGRIAPHMRGDRSERGERGERTERTRSTVEPRKIFVSSKRAAALAAEAAAAEKKNAVVSRTTHHDRREPHRSQVGQERHAGAKSHEREIFSPDSHQRREKPGSRERHPAADERKPAAASHDRHGATTVRHAAPPAQELAKEPALRQRPAAPAGKLRSDELVGRIQFRAGGSAFVVRESVAGEVAEPALQVFPEDTGVALPGDRVLAREFAGRKGRRPGEKIGGVVRVLDRERHLIVGELRTGRRGYIVQPDDPRFSYEIHVSDPTKSGVTPMPKPGDKVTVKLGEWKRRDEPLRGTITSRLGRTHEPRAELLGIFIKYNLATEFPGDVEREAATLPDRVHASELTGRLDYRHEPVFTIDPDDAKDFDDALSYEVLPSGDVRIGIHIADVSTYVKPGTALDREAQKRGNSTYLVGVVIPMLPEKLSNGLCSLVEAQDRLCKAVLLTFGKNGKIKDTSFANTVIRSRKRLTYKQAYALMFQDDLEQIRALPLPAKHQTGSTGRALRDLSDRELHDLQTWVRALWKIASRLRHERMAHGSLDLDFPETKIYVDEKGYAERLEKIENDESHQLIEEFMLAANEAVARLTRSHRLPSLYRVHDEPDPEKLDELRSLLDTFGIHTGDLNHREELLKLLERLRTHPQGYTLRTQLLRSLKKAAYRHTADGHFGLNKKDYSHFTSPIRRYADLVVHRVFDHHLAHQAGPSHATRAAGYDLPRVERLGEHLSLTEVNSAEAERDSVKVKILEFFEREVEKRPKTIFAAIITDVRANGFFIELTESMTFGFVSALALGDDYYSLNTSGDALVGRKKKKRYTTNQRLDVVVEKVDRYKRLIDFMSV
ncbi:MAG: RNB domain-containing ribonuclease [Opitutaceae bacterium]|nr:RNB domain-containing ribonuclease [Opitutaceae bacterium]